VDCLGQELSYRQVRRTEKTRRAVRDTANVSPVLYQTPTRRRASAGRNGIKGGGNALFLQLSNATTTDPMPIPPRPPRLLRAHQRSSPSIPPCALAASHLPLPLTGTSAGPEASGRSRE